MTDLILKLSCDDRPGLVADVSSLIVSEHGNILEAAQFDDLETGRFFMRVRFDLPGSEEAVRRQNIWHNSRRKLAECGPRPGVDIKRRSCGGASGDVRWSSV